VVGTDPCLGGLAPTPYASDTQSRIFYKKLVHVDLYKKLDCVSCFLVQVFS